MCIYSFWCNIYFIFLETDCRFCSHQGQRDRELEVVQPSPSPQNKEESLFYARGPVFARFILIASEPTNSFLSAETELRNLCALIIPNTRLDLSPLLTPTRSPNTTEMFPSPPAAQDHRPAPLSPTPTVETWLSASPNGALSLQRMLKGLLLAQPQV